MPRTNAKTCYQKRQSPILGLVLWALISMSCSQKGEYAITTLELGPGRSIDILASYSNEVTQSFYYQVRVDGKIVVPLHMICAGHDSGQLKFKVILARHGEVVGVFEQKHPDEVLAMHDFSSNASWPKGTGYGNTIGPQAGDEVLKELQAEHPQTKLKMGQTYACE